jgi:hypothetical protein
LKRQALFIILTIAITTSGCTHQESSYKVEKQEVHTLATEVISTTQVSQSLFTFNSANYAIVSDFGSNLFGYIDETGTYTIIPQFISARSFSQNGLALVQDAKNQLYGYIDKSGRYIIQPQFMWASDFSSNGLAAVKDLTSELWGYIDETGSFVIQPFSGSAGDFAENGLAAASVDSRENKYFGYIDRTGQFGSCVKPK